MLGTLASHWNKEKFRCYEAKIEESEKASSRRESNPGHLVCAASPLPLSYDNRTTTCTCTGGTEMPQLHHLAATQHVLSELR